MYIIFEPKEKHCEKGLLEMCTQFVARIPIKGEQCVKIFLKTVQRDTHRHEGTQARDGTKSWKRQHENRN